MDSERKGRREAPGFADTAREDGQWGRPRRVEDIELAKGTAFPAPRPQRRPGVPGGNGSGQMSAQELQHLDNLIDKWRSDGKSLARELDQRGFLCSSERVGYIEGRIATMLAEDLASIPAHRFKLNGVTPTNPADMKRAIEAWLAREAKEISGER